MSGRYLLVGDTHLGKSRTLYPGRLAEQSQVWRQTLQLAVDRGCDAILHAGDVFDRNRPDHFEIEAFLRPLVEVPGPPVYAITGNVHDVSGRDTIAATEVIDLAMERLHVSRRPEVIELPGGMALCTLPWVSPAGLALEIERVAGRLPSRDELHVEASEFLLTIAQNLYAQAEGPAILLGHWSVSGSTLPTGLPVDQLHDVILPALEIEAAGFEHCVYGHIHEPQEFCERSLYVGSPQALDFSEIGDHGCWILDDRRLSFVPLDSRPFLTLTLAELDGSVDAEGAVVRVKDTIAAGDRIDVGEIRAGLIAAGAHHVKLELTTERAARPDREPLLDTDHDPFELLRAWLADDDVDTDRLADMARGYLHGDRAAVA